MQFRKIDEHKIHCIISQEEMSQKGIEPSHIEGRATGWILLDYGSVIVHVFTGESREFYNLERLWSDAALIDISDIADNRD